MEYKKFIDAYFGHGIRHAHRYCRSLVGSHRYLIKLSHPVSHLWSWPPYHVLV